MDSLGKNGRRGETEAHRRLKRLALVWAQAHGYSACGVEVNVPQCRYRADVAGFKPDRDEGIAAIFECKQTLVDLRRDNGNIQLTRHRLKTIHQRREVLERNLRIHYPGLRVAESLFAEFDPYNFQEINHRGYNQVVRQLRTLQNRLFDCTKFEMLVRYRRANLFFLVLPDELFRESEIPLGWGALVAKDETLVLALKPIWHQTTREHQLRFLQRIAMAGTRLLNRHSEITFDEVTASRARC